MKDNKNSVNIRYCYAKQNTNDCHLRLLSFARYSSINCFSSEISMSKWSTIFLLMPSISFSIICLSSFCFCFNCRSSVVSEQKMNKNVTHVRTFQMMHKNALLNTHAHCAAFDVRIFTHKRQCDTFVLHKSIPEHNRTMEFSYIKESTLIHNNACITYNAYLA